MLALGSSAWYVLQSSEEVVETVVTEVNSMEEEEGVEELVRHTGTLRLTTRLLVVCLALAAAGLTTSLLLLLAVRISSRPLFLPWLTFNVLVILSLLGSGLYLVIHFSLLLEAPDYLRAALASPLLLMGIFLIFLWILVDQLFLALGHRKLLVRVASSFRGSRASLASRPRAGAETPGSARSVASGPRGGRGAPRRARSAPRSAPSRRRREEGWRVREFSCRLDLPGRGERSRSLEHILGSSSSEESSVYSRQPAVASLPRLRRSREQPGMFQAEFQLPAAATERLHRRAPRQAEGAEGGTLRSMRSLARVEADTLRSVRSLASVKSVTIHPQVTEYHYRGREAGEAAYYNPGAEEEQEVQERGEVQEEAQEEVPAPVYPSLDWRERRRGLTRDQIIGYYCQPGDAQL